MNAPVRSPVVWFTTLFVLLMTASALRALFDPQTAAAGFGIPVEAGAGAFVRVYGSRNLLIAGFALLAVWLDWRRPAALLISLAALLPLADLWILSVSGRWGPVVGRHLTIQALLVLDAGLLWWRARPARARPPAAALEST